MLKYCFLCVALLLSNSICRAEVYSNPAEHFSMTVPDGWTKLSAEELARYNQFDTVSASAPHCEAGYRAASGTPHAGTLLLIYYLNGHIDSLTGFANGVRAGAEKAAASAGPASSTQPTPKPEVNTDQARNTVTLVSYTPSPNGLIQSQGTSFLGRNGLVAVSWIERKDQLTNSSELLTNTLASFHFDPQFAYTDFRSDSDDLSRKMGIVIGIVIVAGFAWWFLRKRKSA